MLFGLMRLTRAERGRESFLSFHSLALALARTHCHWQVAPDLVADLYERWVMPLTKEVEVQYLLRRLPEI
jgi:hypothetical protein